MVIVAKGCRWGATWEVAPGVPATLETAFDAARGARVAVLDSTRPEQGPRRFNALRAIFQTMRPLTTDMTDLSKRPYFLWDEDVTIGELREILESGSEYDRTRLLAKMLREARDVDVWHFVTPERVSAALSSLGRRLGRRRAFWEFLIRGWQTDGLLAS